MTSQKLSDITLIAFDIETSGGYPLESEICEIAAVKWKNNQIIDQFHTLIKPTKKMSDFIIGIHGITNEMVAKSPRIEEKIGEFYSFIQDGICIAHHSPFDIGFVAIEFEKRGLFAPQKAALCTSLLARKLFPESTNHKLQTLVEFFKFQKNQAHRALDDAKMCLNVALKCFDKFGMEKTLGELYAYQNKNITWQNFYIAEIKKNPAYMPLITAVLENRDARIIYKIGNLGRDKRVKPQGVVRSPDGDFMFALCYEENKTKRYYLQKVLESEIL